MSFIIKPLISEKMNNITEKSSVERTFKAKTGAHRGEEVTPASIYAKLHKATTLPDSSIQPVFCNQVQNGVSQSCRCVYIA